MMRVGETVVKGQRGLQDEKRLVTYNSAVHPFVPLAGFFSLGRLCLRIVQCLCFSLTCLWNALPEGYVRNAKGGLYLMCLLLWQLPFTARTQPQGTLGRPEFTQRHQMDRKWVISPHKEAMLYEP